jgi:hypothetical protein
MTLKAVQFLALVLTALALIPSGAHLFALPNKIGLAQEQYLIVQNIYRGRSLFGIVLTGALIANLALAVVLRRRGAPFVLALLRFLLRRSHARDFLRLGPNRPKDGGTLRTIREACDYWPRSARRALQQRWQHACKLVLEEADIAAMTSQPPARAIQRRQA